MIPWTDLKDLKECEVRIEYTARNGAYLTHTGTVKSVGMKYIHVETLAGSGNVYRVPVRKITLLKDLKTGDTVHNFLLDGMGAALSSQRKE